MDSAYTNKTVSELVKSHVVHCLMNDIGTIRVSNQGIQLFEEQL